MAATGLPNPLAALGKSADIIKTVLTLVIVLIVFFGIKKIITNFKRRNAGLAVGVDPSQLNPAKNYDNYAKLIHDTMDDYFATTSSMEGMAQTIMALSDNEIKQVNNRYRSLYGNGERSMHDALVDWYLCRNCSTLIALAKRVENLGLA